MAKTDIQQVEHYISHALSELHSKRNDGWVEEHYRKELADCGRIIDEYLESLDQQIDMFEGTESCIKAYQKERLNDLRKKIDEIQRP